MDKKKSYEFRLFLIRFFIIGMMAYIVEPVGQGLLYALKGVYSFVMGLDYMADFKAASIRQVGTLAFFVYCWAAIPFTFFTEPLKKVIKDNVLFPGFGRLVRGMIFGLLFMSIEFIAGLFLLLVLNMRAWDYSDIPFNIMGITTFAFFPAWTIGGMLGEWVHDRLLQIDDILLNPEGLSEEGIAVHQKKYEESIARKKRK